MKNNLVLIAWILSFPPALGSHLKGGSITAEPINCTSRLFKITVTVFTDMESGVFFGGTQDYLDFGDGSDPDGDGIPGIIVPETPNSLVPNEPQLGTASYSIVHAFPGLGSYIISYKEPNRNSGIINFDNSVLTTFYLESNLILNGVCSGTPQFLASPIFYGEFNSNFSLSIGASSPEGNFLYYELVTPKRDRNIPVSAYKLPENFEINPLNGLVTWNTKFEGNYTTGEYLFAVKVKQYVLQGSELIFVGFVVRDFQIILTEGNSGGKIYDNQGLDLYSRLLVRENQNKKIKVFFETTGSSPELEVFSELEQNSETFSFSSYDSTFEALQIKVGVIVLTGNASTLRDSPYLITTRGMEGNVKKDLCYLVYTKELPDPELPLIVGLEDELISIQIFPNPVQQILKIELGKTEPIEILFYDQQGMLLISRLITETTMLDLSAFLNGIYFCEIRRGAKSLKKVRIVKY